jgi:hypothetical protein
MSGVANNYAAPLFEEAEVFGLLNSVRSVCGIHLK